MKKCLISIFFMLGVLILTSKVFATFTDLEGYDWAKEYIEDFERRGIVSGTSVNTFSPGNNVKREEFVKIIVNLFQYDMEGAECDFVDVQKENWFYPYVAAATNAGIINGVGDNRFGAGRDITREDICTILYRVLKNKGYTLKKIKEEGLPFEDASEISDYAYEAVEEMYQAGVINGMDATHMSPKSNATRAQMVKMAYLSDEQKMSNGGEQPEASGEEPTKEQATLEINKTSMSLTVGEKETLQVTVKPKEVAKEAIEWSTSNAKIAKVNNGKVEAIAKGTATITAKLKNTNLTVSCEVTVKEDPSSGGSGGGGGGRRWRWRKHTDHNSGNRSTTKTRKRRNARRRNTND